MLFWRRADVLVGERDSGEDKGGQLPDVAVDAPSWADTADNLLLGAGAKSA